MNLQDRVNAMLRQHKAVLLNSPRRELIAAVVQRREAMVAANGCLATWTPPESSGRSPMDTYTVRRPESEGEIDWDSPNNIPMAPDTFDLLLEDALHILGIKATLYVTDRVLVADPRYAMPVRVISDRALTALFCDNMFRPVPPNVQESVLAKRGFTLVAAPYDKLDRARYEGRLRRVGAKTSNMSVVMDMDRRMGIIYGSAYGGSVKKMMFSVMNYVLPSVGVLPLHCSANEGAQGDIALLLGLSGTGKTTLSADPRRKLLGDDEHSWSDEGVANFEYGCYAKLINLRQSKEPQIWNAVFHEAPYLEHGAIVENAMIYPNGLFDVDDARLTPNSRASFPLSFLDNVKEPPVGGHPRTILFLTADANGVLPPVARLSPEQAMLWFLMGYTSKLAGTETGIIDPESTFSRFFGSPFMPRNPDVYANMLGDKMREHKTEVYLINTGWTGGVFGVGHRIDIDVTRALVNAALSGQMRQVEYDLDPLFHVWVPRSCPDVDPSLLKPSLNWSDQEAFQRQANKLAADFAGTFDKTYGKKGIAAAIAAECPGH
ncbi:MAG TPA: phosphoenolpyruvate carboxykinase (ATP) [Anaerolineae bacterium]|nr:phosphoenolpyruvate carboxykinase (ATP) [Anaerolineae bacterium]